MDAGRIQATVDSLMTIAERARKYQGYIDAKRQSVADEMLSVARTCKDRTEWNSAYNILKSRYKSQHAKANLPKVMSQVASDIKAMYDEGVDLNKQADGKPLTFSQLRKEKASLAKVRNAQVSEANERAKPQIYKDFETTLALVQATYIDKERQTYRENNPLVAECLEAIKEIMRKHGDLVKASVREDAGSEEGTEGDRHELAELDAPDADHRAANVG
jgi:hypothetical protein